MSVRSEDKLKVRSGVCNEVRICMQRRELRQLLNVEDTNPQPTFKGIVIVNPLAIHYNFDALSSFSALFN